ncbi:MAG: hypothetical protein ACYTFA_07010 [Planctomycetota bacterium]|jgi:hypothetical protein
MLDFSKLRAPAEHGGTLIEPLPAGWITAARANADALRIADTPLLGSTLADWRRKTRQAIVGGDDRLVIVTGHQPAFIHPGVWAKHVVATRLADAVGGVAVNLIVDSDAVKQSTIAVPSVQEGSVLVKNVPFADVPFGSTYEQIRLQTPEQTAQFEQAARDALGDRYEGSQMPAFFRALGVATDARDWVDQVVAARRAVEATFGVALEDRRVSGIWCSALVVDAVLNASRLADCYNRALAAYRKSNRVRGAGRPIPDLAVDSDRCEAPLWAYRPGEPRRRLFVHRKGDSLRLLAGGTEIGAIPAGRLDSCESLADALGRLDGWQLRPRALTLTIWARLLLADLFIHGIGGAKYDRISDSIIADYYGLAPPHMVCASATLHMSLPARATTSDDVRRLRHELRDLRYNPQRHVPENPEAALWIERRVEAVSRSIELRTSASRDREARHHVFTRIREISAALLASQPGMLAAKQAGLAAALRNLQETKIALGREYFFGLYDTQSLEELTQALPAQRVFRII